MSGEVGDDLTDEELLFLEEAIARELVEQDERLLREFEAEERLRAAEVDFYAAQQHEEQQQGAQGAAAAIGVKSQETVPCPVCRSGYVHLSHSVFHCQCGFRIDGAAECLGLDHFRARLASAFEQHASQSPACHAAPAFALVPNFAAPVLMMQCPCSFVHVVL